MAKVVLISPPFVSDYMRNARCDFVSLSNSSWYPIWLGQAGSYLEGKGHKTRLMDAQIAGLDWNQSFQEIQDFYPDFVVVYTGRLSEDNDIQFADELEAKGFPVAFVGPYTSINPAEVLKKAKRVKYAVRKEFDLPLEEWSRGDDPTKIPNFYVKQTDGTVTHTAERALYKQEILDTFPLTSEYFHRQLDLYKYKTPSELFPFMDIMSGRGCAWGRCNFCLWVQTFVPGSVYNLRSIEHFMAEFDYIHKYIPEVRSVMIQDDMITNKRAIEVSEEMLKRDYKLPWSCYAKPNSNLSQETLLLMKKAGCLNLHVGFESGDDEVLKKMDKGSNVAQAIEFAEMAHKAGLKIHADFALGHIGETRESMMRTIELAKKMNPHTAQFQIMIPFKGTKYWDQLHEIDAMGTHGKPSFEKAGGPTMEEIEQTAKLAYRKFYFSTAYLKKILADPKDYFFNRLDQYIKAIPAVTYKKWIR